MPWIKRKADEHRCPLPRIYFSSEVATGDVWECDACGKEWVVFYSADPRPGESGYLFKSIPEVSYGGA